MRVTFEIAGLIPSLNTLLRRHWAVRRKLQADWDNWLAWSPTDVEKRWLRTMWWKKTKMRVRIVAHRNKLLDVDNLYGSTGKICLDAMKKAKFIYDDRPEFCDAEVSQVKSKEQKITFEIEEFRE
jgi:hypothetical protein